MASESDNVTPGPEVDLDKTQRKMTDFFQSNQTANGLTPTGSQTTPQTTQSASRLNTPSVQTILTFSKPSEDKGLDRLHEISGLLCRSLEAARDIVKDVVTLRTAPNSPATPTTQIVNSTLLDPDAQIDQNQINADESTMLSETLRGLKKSIETFNERKIDIQRDYKLSNKTTFRLWYDYLKSKVKYYGFLDVLEPSEQIKQYSKTEEEDRKSTCREIIIHRLNDFYHKLIAHESDPLTIIQTVKDFKKMETNTSHTAVRQRLYQIKMKSKERVSEFISKFEPIARQNDNCKGSVALTEAEVRPAFYNAINAAVPEIRQSCIAYKQTNNREMSYQQLKSALLQIESDKRSDNQNQKKQTPEPAKANFVNPKQYQNKHNTEKCFRCSKYGHVDTVCPLIEKGLYFCYIRKEITRHRGKY